MAADDLTHILHSSVGHFYFVSVDDTSQDIVFRKVVNDLEKFFSNVSFNVAGEGWIEPHDFSCSVFPQALAGICGRIMTVSKCENYLLLLL